MGALFVWSVLVSDIIRFLDSQILLWANFSTSAEYIYCWFSWGSGCSKSIVHPQYISNTSTQFIPRIEVAKRLYKFLLAIFVLCGDNLVCDGYVGQLLHMHYSIFWNISAVIHEALVKMLLCCSLHQILILVGQVFSRESLSMDCLLIVMIQLR